jgi:histone H3/H4
MSDLLIVRSKLKDITGGFNVSGDFAAALSAKVEVLIKDAVSRAEANGRKTVKARDL